MRTLVLGRMPEGAAPDKFLAAGPWCFVGQENNFPNWERRFSFAPEPLQTPGLLPVAARACQTLCLRLIPRAAEMLAAEPAKFPPDYWQILLAPWLMDVCSQVIDRSLRVAAMRDLWADESLVVPLLPADCAFNFANEQDFTLRGSLGIDFNHWLFSRLLEADWPRNWTRTELPQIQQQAHTSEHDIFKRIHSIARNLQLRMLFPKIKGLSLRDAIKLSEALDHACKQPDHSLDLEATFDFQSDLEKIRIHIDLLPIIRKALPDSILRLKHKPPAKDKKAPRLRVAAISYHEDAEYRQRLAIWRCQGNRLAHIQHGANYGQVETPCAAAITEYSQDAFFTWGWKTHGCTQGNFIPLPSFLLSEEWKWQGGKKLIFIGTEMSAYGRRLDSHPTPLQYLEYRAAKAAFFEELGPELQAESLYRPYFPLPGVLEDAQWLLPQFPSLGLCSGDLLPQILHSRLLVIDHPGTTLLEAMAYGIPLVAYWNRKFWPFTPAAVALLDVLEAAGIWYDSPKSAASAVKGIWHDPSGWTMAPERKMARDVFCRHQALAAPDAINQWQTTLRDL